MTLATLCCLTKHSNSHEPNSNKLASVDSTVITVLIVPCSNGYDYQTYGFDLNPSIEKYLSAIKNIKIKPMSLKKMKGHGYQGVFDKKYCDRILQNHDVDFLIMTKIKGDLTDYRKFIKGTWGYETKILETSTMIQTKGISAENLETFKDIDLHVKQNISKLEKLINKNK